MNVKFAVGVTLYNPLDEYIDNIKKYSGKFDYVFVYDNTENGDRYYKEELEYIENIIYMSSGGNIGLPKAFNVMLSACKERDVDYLCTLDQDSKLSDEVIDGMRQLIIADKDEIAIYAVNPVSKIVDDVDLSGENHSNVNWVICSGSFLNVALLEKNNISYDEKYYIDRFDADFCKQITERGLIIRKYYKLYMYHECGDDGSHSALRHYYMFRNRRYYNDKYYNPLISKIRTHLQDIRHIWKIRIWEDDWKRKIKCRSYAIKDYRNNRMGKISDETHVKIEEE